MKLPLQRAFAGCYSELQLASGRQINTVSNRPLILPSIIPCAFHHWLLSAPSLSTISPAYRHKPCSLVGCDESLRLDILRYSFTRDSPFAFCLSYLLPLLFLPPLTPARHTSLCLLRGCLAALLRQPRAPAYELWLRLLRCKFEHRRWVTSTLLRPRSSSSMRSRERSESIWWKHKGKGELVRLDPRNFLTPTLLTKAHLKLLQELRLRRTATRLIANQDH